MKEILFFILGFVIYFSGYFIGKLSGWSSGYDDCHKLVMKELNHYFDERTLFEQIKKEKTDDNTPRNPS